MKEPILNTAYKLIGLKLAASGWVLQSIGFAHEQIFTLERTGIKDGVIEEKVIPAYVDVAVLTVRARGFTLGSVDFLAMFKASIECICPITGEKVRLTFVPSGMNISSGGNLNYKADLQFNLTY